MAIQNSQKPVTAKHSSAGIYVGPSLRTSSVCRLGDSLQTGGNRDAILQTETFDGPFANESFSLQTTLNTHPHTSADQLSLQTQRSSLQIMACGLYTVCQLAQFVEWCSSFAAHLQTGSSFAAHLQTGTTCKPISVALNRGSCKLCCPCGSTSCTCAYS